MDKATIIKRNEYIKRLFKSMGYDVVLLGTVDAPKIMCKGELLACYVHNFDLHFMNKAFNGTSQFSIKLREVQINPAKYDFDKWYNEAVHRSIFYLYVKEEKFNMYVAGFDKSKTIDLDTSEVVFSLNKESIKIYYSREEANKIAAKYSELIGLKINVEKY